MVMKLYHGSYSVIEKPEIIKSKFSKDFGQGFYCTEIEAQANRWASRYEKAVISMYEYVPDNDLKMLVFREIWIS